MTIDSFIIQLCEHCGLSQENIVVKIDEEDTERIKVTVNLSEEDSGLFIGYHGETLDSLQRIVRLVFLRTFPDKKIELNINEYREEREEKLREMVENIGQRVLDSGRPYTFNSFLPAHERFIIHSTLSENSELSGLESISDGQGRNRRLTIQLKNES